GNKGAAPPPKGTLSLPESSNTGRVARIARATRRAHKPEPS
ncbi:MAG TPA: rRNA pseudouridine synthase, partial [Rhodospirillum rubrum]|nr:rRNA pseudouridine synthase [Rhodospirillum rubrum]